MEKQTLYLVSGRIFVGKDTFAQYLVKSHPEAFDTFALASKLKQITFVLLKHFNVPIDSVEDLDNREKKEQYRSHMQIIATECFRKVFGQDFWCKALESDIQQSFEKGKSVIISDVRFPNEQEYFKSRFKNVKCVMIHRPGYDNAKITHSSEDTSKLSVDIDIYNNGSLEEFYKRIDNIVNPYTTTSEDYETEDLIELQEPEPEVVERGSIIIEPEKNDLIINDSLFNEKMNQNANKNSSIGLGEIGESYVLDLIRSIRPKNDSYDTSSNAHVADLHSIDYFHNIHWVIEVKNKENLTKNDIDKFRDDIANVNKQNVKNMKVVGLFLSIRSVSIPRIGDVYISQNEIYLSKNYFTPEILEIVFSFVEQYKDLLSSSPQPESKTIEYVMSQKLISLFALLNTEYQRINEEVKLLAQMKENSKSNLSHIEELLVNTQLRQRLIFLLNEQVKSFDNTISTTTFDVQYNEFVDSLKNERSKDKVLKGSTLKKWPELSDQINKLSWKEFLNQAWEVSHHDQSNDMLSNFTTEDEQNQFLLFIKELKSNPKISKSEAIKSYPLLKQAIGSNYIQFRKQSLEHANSH